MSNTERITAVRNSIGTILAHLAILEKNGHDYSAHKTDLLKLDNAMYFRIKYECEPAESELS